MTLNVLIVESKPGAGRFASDDLRAAGHNVMSCHTDDHAFPCVGIDNPSVCPLRATAVDVALLVREEVHVVPTASEDGARCALFRKIPLVVSGEPTLSPYSDHAAASIEPEEDVVAACERVAREPVEPLSRRATEMLATSAGPDCGHVVVTRERARLRVAIHPNPRLTRADCARAGVRIVQALRELDPFAAGIDVAVHPDS